MVVLHRSQSPADIAGKHSIISSMTDMLKTVPHALLNVAHEIRQDTDHDSASVEASTPDSGYFSEHSASDQSFFNKGDCYQGEPQNDDERRVFALVIGIDEYKSRDVPPLRGCKNDGEDFVRLLVNDLFIPEDRIKKLFNEDAERSSIINGFWNHLFWNPDIRKGDVVLFYFSGHGASATAPEGWAAERKQIEILCPYDYDPKNGVYGIPDYTLDALMQSLKDNKGDNIIAILDCCHSGGMDREQLAEDEGVRGIRDCPDSKPLPRTLDQEILSPPLRKPMASLDQPFATYRVRAAHVTLAACSSQEKAKEKLCSFIPVAGSPPVQEIRGVFSVNLISMLRNLGRDGMKAWSYSHLMTELLRRGSFFDSLPSLSGQNPECKGRKKNRAFFSNGGPVDAAESFVITKHDDAWHVQAGTVHGVVPGTEFRLTRTAMQRMGHRASMDSDIILCATDVEALKCRLDYPLPDDLEHCRVVVVRWGSANSVLTKVSIRDAGSTPSLGLPMPHAVAADELYQVVPENSPHDLILDVSQKGTVSRIERRDPLVTTFCSTTRTRDLASALLPAARVLNYIARFNFHLYRMNTAKENDNEIKVKALFHAGERTLAEIEKYWNRPDMGPDDQWKGIILHTLLAKYNLRDTRHELRVLGGTNSNITISKPVWEIALGRVDKHFYGFTLVNDSKVDLFPYVFYFDPDTYAITPVYISESTTVAPLPKEGTLTIGHDIQSISPHSQTHLGFLKLFVTTRYVDLNIEQPAVFGPPAGHVSAPLSPHSKGAALVSLPRRDCWNAWVYVLTSETAKKHTL